MFSFSQSFWFIFFWYEHAYIYPEYDFVTKAIIIVVINYFIVIFIFIVIVVDFFIVIFIVILFFIFIFIVFIDIVIIIIIVIIIVSILLSSFYRYYYRHPTFSWLLSYVLFNHNLLSPFLPVSILINISYCSLFSLSFPHLLFLTKGTDMYWIIYDSTVCVVLIFTHQWSPTCIGFNDDSVECGTIRVFMSLWNLLPLMNEF